MVLAGMHGSMVSQAGWFPHLMASRTKLELKWRGCPAMPRRLCVAHGFVNRHASIFRACCVWLERSAGTAAEKGRRGTGSSMGICCDRGAEVCEFLQRLQVRIIAVFISPAGRNGYRLGASFSALHWLSSSITSPHPSNAGLCVELEHEPVQSASAAKQTTTESQNQITEFRSCFNPTTTLGAAMFALAFV